MKQKSDESNFEKFSYKSLKGDSLLYQLLKPIDYDKQKKYPLVLFLHGVYERGNDNELQSRDIQALFLNEKNRINFPCFVLAPQCPKTSGWANWERIGEKRVLREKPSLPVELLLELIPQLCLEFSIDTQRLYITGLSMGAFGTFDILLRKPNLFAAAVSICGGGVENKANLIKHIPVWIFHGALDQVVEVEQSRAMVKALKEAGGKPRYTEYANVKHDSWVNAYKDPDLLPWLFSQNR